MWNIKKKVSYTHSHSKETSSLIILIPLARLFNRTVTLKSVLRHCKIETNAIYKIHYIYCLKISEFVFFLFSMKTSYA